jgi:carbamoyltransferase
MLYDHRVRTGWATRVPAVVHVDGSARLQTINDRQNPTIATVLRAYHRSSGVPLLCNTSANHAGCGFFPDLASAMEWGEADMIWSEGIAYNREPGSSPRYGDR